MANLEKMAFESLSPLLGLKLSVAHCAGDVRLFHFGSNPFAGDQYGLFAIHLQCPWRLETADAILTGLSDWYTPARRDVDDDENWDPAKGGSLQEAVLRELMKDLASSSRAIVNRSDNLVVTDIRADSFGGFRLGLSGGVQLSVFPSGSRGEQWRLLQPKTEVNHFVVEYSG